MIENDYVIKVGIADMRVTKAPYSLRTSGLGSCVGIVIYDQQKEIAGLAHIMLPDSTLVKEGKNKAKYADLAVEDLINELSKLGANRKMLKAKIAGGAQMFQFLSGSDIMRIGPRNIEAVIHQLKQYKIQLIASDVGGNKGRTIEFNPATSSLSIRTVNQGTKII